MHLEFFFDKSGQVTRVINRFPSGLVPALQIPLVQWHTGGRLGYPEERGRPVRAAGGGGVIADQIDFQSIAKHAPTSGDHKLEIY